MEQEVINFSESEHPRKKDGTFAKKEDIEIDKNIGLYKNKLMKK